MMVVNIYLKSRKHPFEYQMTPEEYKKFLTLLQTKDIIELGAIVFSRDNFSYSEIIE